MNLHILTAVTRLQNLPEIERSFATAITAGVMVKWHTLYDPERQHAGGQALKNKMLDTIYDGWVWICDDDNQAQSGFFAAIAAVVRPEVQMIVCAQQHRNGWVRKVFREMLRETHVDAAQVVVRREAIGKLRIPEHYCGDGGWIESIANSLRDDQIAYIREPVVSYNWLRMSEWR